jgi:hypothetical protein
MDTSNNYINQNEELRNTLLDLLFGGPISIQTHNNIITQSETNENITNNLNSDLSDNLIGESMVDAINLTSIDNDYINFFRNYFFRNRTTQSPISFESILQQSFMDPSQNIFKKVLSDEGEDDIKTVIYKKGKFPNDSCSVTLMDFEEGQEVSQLPCGHIFVRDAVLKWLKDENASCPICREPLASKEVKKKKKNEVLTRTQNQRLRPRVRRENFMQNYIQRQIQREEEAEIQAAIIASLRDQNIS